MTYLTFFTPGGFSVCNLFIEWFRVALALPQPKSIEWPFQEAIMLLPL
jgi:hypothetical protein